MAVEKSMTQNGLSVAVRKNSGSIKEMHPYIYDEFEYARVIAYRKFAYQPTQDDLNYLACYYLETGKDNVSKALYKYVDKHCANIYEKMAIEENYGTKIVKAVKFARGHRLQRQDYIYFNKKEMDKILSQDTIYEQHVLFVICAFAKHNRMFNFGNKAWSCKAPVEEMAQIVPYYYPDKAIKSLIKKGIITRMINYFYVDWLEEVVEEQSVLKLKCGRNMIKNDFEKFMFSYKLS